MSKKLKSITLIFENVESMVIPAYKILAWRIGDITTGLLGVQSDVNVHEYDSCKCFEITINKNLLDSIYTAGYEGLNSKTTHRDRLDFSDITAVELEYADGTVKSYYVPWKCGLDGYNSYQHWDKNSIIICNNADWEEYKKLNGCVDSDHQNKDIPDVEPESKPEPKVGVCDICGKECQCNGLSFIDPDGSVYQTWNICDDCAKTIWNGIRIGIVSKLTARHLPFIVSDVTELNFLIKQNMIHIGVDKDYIDKELQMYYGVNTEELIQSVREIVGE